MFRIAICDDEATSLKLNTILTQKVLQEEGIAYEIKTFVDMNEMTEALASTVQPFDVLLSDILATGMNGIEAAEKLRTLGEQLDIIFISTTAEYALEGYRVQALRYLQKPVDIEKLREALLLSYEKNQNKEGISISSEGKVFNVSFKDIIYIESDARDVELVLKYRHMVSHMKISDVEKLLPEKRFFRCHRSYIVNLDEVQTIERYQATMKNQEIVPISQQQYSEIKNRMYKSQR
ncbi:MAG TPA: LytTR family DNA-binding domain-containing protein [Lachnospiraceae bacterium]|nr:LytTR family DNA-binding domain-containing protein [Lachnospiraceae bacterium]HPF29635.1 LytTR family DNA-binding domain-containing protein [Lachnospiraceae bacterium]